MRFKKLRTTAIGLAAILYALSCTENTPEKPTPPPLNAEPIGVQLLRVDPALQPTPFRVLLDFERPTDLAFLTGQSFELTPTPHTGQSALQAKPGSPINIKLSALTAWPSTWSLAGAYLKPLTPHATATLTLGQLKRTVELPANTWTPAFLDLTPITAQPNPPVLLTIQSDAPILIDDVTVINNTKILDAPANPNEGWTIAQSGFNIVIDRPQKFRIALKTPQAAPDGWNIEEVSELRVRLVSATSHYWTLYNDGRQYKDAVFSTLNTLPNANSYAQQHASPAEITIPPWAGRIDRDTPGDKNNDAYNEQRAAYQCQAKGPRFECTLAPTTKTLIKPTLEITNLPPGPLQITAEGQLFHQYSRLPNGTVLIELPLAVSRAITINVAVK